ncbi:MAG: hypothetical protein V2I65_00485 [Paracoccaceae bacterium]|jgi:hypothetical protein|nr:hypothetical protein [Paracoccaceae bacterium]
MTAEARPPAPPDPMRGTRRALRGMLMLQVGLALALAAAEIGRALPPGGWPGGLPFAPPGARPPGLEAPVAPGDQRRRFAPSDLPDLPAAGDMPSRLLFEQEGDIARATGMIASGDGARFAEWLASRSEPPVTLALHSTGGSVSDALEIGRAVRSAGLETEVAAKRLCLSACPYILAGGVARRVGEGAAVGVHQHYHGENSYLPAFLAVEDIQRGQAEVMAHLSDMGVDPRVMIPALSTPPAEIYVLLPDELVRHGLVTPDGS